MSDLDLSALRKVAEAARDNAAGIVWFSDKYSMLHGKDGPDAQHISTFDPPTVLALLDELETLRALTKPPEVGFSSVGRGSSKGVQLRQVSDG